MRKHEAINSVNSVNSFMAQVVYFIKIALHVTIEIGIQTRGPILA